MPAAKLYLLSEDGLGLTAETLLLAIVTATALRRAALLRLLVLCHLVQLVALALLAECAALLGHVHLCFVFDAGCIETGELSRARKHKHNHHLAHHHSVRSQRFCVPGDPDARKRATPPAPQFGGPHDERMLRTIVARLRDDDGRLAR